MLFLTYWELNEEIPYGERMRIAKRLTESDLFPPKNVKMIRWDSTPDGWGITVFEAPDASAVLHALNLWRAAAPGFFKCTKTAPAAPAQETIAEGVQIEQEMKLVDLSALSSN
jgi:hypothetical protein